MKTMVLIFFLGITSYVYGMEQQEQQQQSNNLQPGQVFESPQPQEFEHVTGELRYESNGKQYYFGTNHIPKWILCNYLACQECNEYAHCTIPPAYIHELIRRDPEYVTRVIQVNAYSCLGCLGSAALVAVIGL